MSSAFTEVVGAGNAYRRVLLLAALVVVLLAAPAQASSDVWLVKAAKGLARLLPCGSGENGVMHATAILKGPQMIKSDAYVDAAKNAAATEARMPTSAESQSQGHVMRQALAVSAEQAAAPSTEERELEDAQRDNFETTKEPKPDVVVDVPMENSHHATVTLYGEMTSVLRFEGRRGNVINSVLQIRDVRRGRRGPYNCEGMEIGISLRTGWVSYDGTVDWTMSQLENPLQSSTIVQPGITTTDADDVSEGSASVSTPFAPMNYSKTSGGYRDNDSGTSPVREAQISFWGLFVFLLDTSPLCKMYQTVSLRLSKAPRTEYYYVILSTSVLPEYRYTFSNSHWGADMQCSLDMYLSQEPAKRLFTMQMVFSVVLPLLVFLVPLPFLLRHADVVTDVIVDVSIADWFWVPPYLLRKLIVDVVTGVYARVVTYRLEKQDRERQRQLEERQRQLSREMNRAMEEAEAAGSPVETQWTSATHHTAPREEKEGTMEEDGSSVAVQVADDTTHPVTGVLDQSGGTNDAALNGEQRGNGSKGGKKAHDVLFTTTSKTEGEEEKCCRICRDGEELERLLAPCSCTGSVRWVHRSCLDHWRMESTERNLKNVNNCEICKQPFNVSISRRTILCEGSKHIINSTLIIFTSVLCLILIVAGTYGGVGELSCLALQHEVAYPATYTFEGITISLLVYCVCIVILMVAHTIVYSWFYRDPVVAEQMRDTRTMPPYWTRRNIFRLIGVYVVLIAQVIAMGYLIKMFLYSTSNVAWNWEIAPILGCLGCGAMLPVLLPVAQWVGAALARCRGTNSPVVDVVIEGAAGSGNGGIRNNPRANDPIPNSQDAEDAAQLPPEMRVIRAMEYCPPHRVAPAS